MKYRMYILPDPMVERPLIPTDIWFELEEDVNNFIAYDLKIWKANEMANPYFGYGYEDTVEVTFLKVF